MLAKKKTVIVFYFFAFSLAVFLIAPFIGIKFLPFSALNKLSEHYLVFWNIRVPRLCLAYLAGSALAISGMNFQAVFRNPLATPFTLGVSSGASFGAVLFLMLNAYFSFLNISIFAFLGGSLSISIVYSLTRIKRNFSTATMLLAGVAISFFFSSWILMIQFLSDFTDSYRILHWLMGGLGAVGFNYVWQVLPFVVCGAAITLMLRNELNLMSVGEDVAVSRGVDADKVKLIIFFTTSFMVGGVVAVCGPIGFVGMIVPHICRLIIGAEHRFLMPAVFFAGGSFLVVCDVISRVVMAPLEIPVGVITALLGGPFFLWLLLRK